MVIHQSITRSNRFGGMTTRSLCGRTNNACDDGMNIGDAKDVTCKFCLKLMRPTEPPAQPDPAKGE